MKPVSSSGSSPQFGPGSVRLPAVPQPWRGPWFACCATAYDPAPRSSIFSALQVVSCSTYMCCAESAPWFFSPPLPSASCCCGTSWGGQKVDFVNVFLSLRKSKERESALFLCRRALPCAGSASLQSELEGLAMLQGAFEVGPSVN